MKRRDSLSMLAALACLPLGAARAQSAAYPGQPVRLVAPYPPGGTVDILSRTLAVPLGRELGQQVFVENKAGANGTLGTDMVAHAPADGLTLLFGAVHQAIAHSIYPKLNYDIRRDLAPVAFLGRVNHVLLVSNGVAAKSVQELITLLKASPDRFNYGTPGGGSLHHLMAEQFKAVTGTSMTHVPYKGSGPAMVDLIGGAIQVYFETMPSALQHIRSGSVRALAVTSRQRSSALPQVPTMAESGLDTYDASSWYGLMVPAKTPVAVVERLNTAVNKAFANVEFANQWKSLGAEPGGGTPQELAKLLSAEVDRWGALAKAANIRAE